MDAPAPGNQLLPPVYNAAPDLPTDVLRHFQRLRRDRPSRRLAEALIERKPLPVDCIEPVALSLSDPARCRWHENLVGVWAAARSANSADRYSAAGWLSHVLEFWPSLDAWPRLKRSYQRTLVVMIAVLAVAVGVKPGTLIGPVFGAIPLCLLAYPFSAWLDRSRLNRIRAEAATGLGILAVPHTAARLAAGALDGDERVRLACRDSLRKVLPTVTADQYGRLSLDTTPRLVALLQDNDETLVLLTLRALGAVGDSRALDPVNRFQRSQRTWHNPEIPFEAQRTFEALYARWKRENDAASLLRPTDSPVQADQSLLRPWVHSGDQPAENLLRAASDESL